MSVNHHMKMKDLSIDVSPGDQYHQVNASRPGKGIKESIIRYPDCSLIYLYPENFSYKSVRQQHETGGYKFSVFLFAPFFIERL